MGAAYGGKGTVVHGTGNVTPGLPSGLSTGDLMLLAVQTADEVVSTPSGWTLIGENGGGTRGVTLFYRRWQSGDTAPTVTDPGDHAIAVILRLSGVASAGNPVSVVGTSGEGVADTSLASAGITALDIEQQLVLFIVAVSAAGVPDSVGTAFFSSWANSSLVSVTEAVDQTTDAGVGGGLGVAVGYKYGAGSTGSFTATLAEATSKSWFTLTIQDYVTAPTMAATALAPVPTIDLHPPTTVTVPAAMTATALAPEPVVGATSVLAEVMAATALAFEPEVVLRVEVDAMTAVAEFPAPFVAIDISVVSPVMTADAAFPEPTIAMSVLIEPPVMTATATAHPITFWLVSEPPAMTATGQAPSPTRAGPVGDSIYRDVVLEIVPPPTGVMDFETDTGLSLLWGDPAGKSRWFDGINDATDLTGLAPTAMTYSVVLWFKFDYDPEQPQPHIWEFDPGSRLRVSTTGPQAGLLELRVSGPYGGGGSEGFGTFFGPDVSDAESHMVVITHDDSDSTLSWYVDGELVDTVDAYYGWDGGVLGANDNLSAVTFFRGWMDELSVFDWVLQAEWVTELWAQGVGDGGAKTRVTVPEPAAVTVASVFFAPTTVIRPVLDSWQLFDDFDDFDFDTEKWQVVEGDPPFIVDGEMTILAGTTIQSRDWFTFGEWVAVINLDPIPADSGVYVEFRLIAASNEMMERVFPLEPIPGPFEDDAPEAQHGWRTFKTDGLRLVERGWSVYSNGWDDVGVTHRDTYVASDDEPVVLTSPHLRLAQYMTGYDSASYYGLDITGDGAAPFRAGSWMYEFRHLRLEIIVSGAPGESVTIRSVNPTGATTVISVPTGVMSTTSPIEAYSERLPYLRTFEGAIGDRRIRPPVARATARMLRPAGQAQLFVENAATAWAYMPDPLWAGDAAPVLTFAEVAWALARFPAPDLVGEPQDVSVEAVESVATGRMFAPIPGGHVPPATGIATFTTRKRPTEVTTRKRVITVRVLELVSV